MKQQLPFHIDVNVNFGYDVPKGTRGTGEMFGMNILFSSNVCVFWRTVKMAILPSKQVRLSLSLHQTQFLVQRIVLQVYTKSF